MGIANQIKMVSNAMLDIIYPNNCTICSTDLNSNESYLCLNCKYDLPYIEQSQYNIESLQKLFWGRVNVNHIFALLNYQKGNQTQKILHELKYNKKTKLAQHFGEMIGDLIEPTENYSYLIPVPLHPKKQQLRGFNQSTVIAKGMLKTTQIPILEKVIKRTQFNKSQTNFSKYDRWDNVKSIFSIVKPKIIENKHVILIDDVLTTGATIEACVKELLKIKGCKVSVAVLAARI
jgi:competence protein ComFC